MSVKYEDSLIKPNSTTGKKDYVLRTIITGVGKMITNFSESNNHIFLSTSCMFEDGSKLEIDPADQFLYLLHTVSGAYTIFNRPDLLSINKRPIAAYVHKTNLLAIEDMVIQHDIDNFGFMGVVEYDDEIIITTYTTDNLAYNLMYIEKLPDRKNVFSFDFATCNLHVVSKDISTMIPFEYSIQNLDDILSTPLDMCNSDLVSLSKHPLEFIPKDKWERQNYFNTKPNVANSENEYVRFTSWTLENNNLFEEE